ncbi:MAG TPA: hypothetical protein VE360_00730 [Pyrinomonadaceae bacterium]|nr:hypothetical protein [Pyrinomonadaceae bacterium]
MRKQLAVIALSAAVLAGGARSFAQTPAPQQPAQGGDPAINANGVLGEVVAVDVNARQIFVKTDAGSVVIVTLADNVVYKKVPPGETSLTKATDIALTDISAGDRIFARGKVSDDRKSVMPRQVIVMSKGDIEQKREAERAEWRRRGVVGVVSALNPETKEITLQTRGPQGPQTVTIAAAGEAVKFRRYAPDSVKFADAQTSAFQDLKVGDQLRAKGEKSADGARFTPEEIVSGAFRTTVGNVTAVNAEKNEVSITQMQGGAPLTVVVSRDSVLKQVPAEFAARFGGGPGGPGGGGPGGGAPGAGGQAQQPAGGGQAGGQSAAAPRPAGGGPGGGGGEQAGGPRRMGGPGGFDIQQMLETLPPVALADLKPGQMIVVSSTVGADPTRVTAIQLLSGVEPLVAMMTRRAGGPGGGPGGGGGGAGGPGGGANFGFGIGQP